MSELFIPDITEDDDTIAAALKYAAAGWYILPVSRATKHAGSILGKGWPSQTSRDPNQIVAWFAGTSDSLALHMGRSGAVAFDVDNPDRIPEQLAKAVADTNAPFQSTRAHVPGRGHYLFAVPEGRMLGNGTGGLGKGWGEVRGLNGIIIVAPSVHEKHADGARYQWERTGPLPTLPDTIGSLLRVAGEAADAATDAQLRTFIQQHTGSARPELLAGVLNQFAAALAAGESRHEASLRITAGAMREAAAGMYPAKDAAERIFAAFAESLSRSRDGRERIRGKDSARAEFMGVLAWAIGQLTDADIEATRRSLAERLPRDDTAGLASLIADTPPEPVAASAPATGTVPVAPAVPLTAGSTAADASESFLYDVEQPATARVAIPINTEPEAITGITDAIAAGAIPDTYVRGGALVQVAEVSGHTLAEQPLALSRTIQTIGPDSLRRLLARHTDVYRKKAATDGGVIHIPASPAVATCKAVLTETLWPGVPPLVNIVGAPVLRPDGSILQDPGYDPATRLYYAPQFPVDRIPDLPDIVDVRRARNFLLNVVLGDFPWATAADLANYMALLISPILRPYIGGVTPLGAISASDRGSGKTLLTDIIGSLYGATVRPWVSDDDELRKAVTSTLMSSNAVVVFDNVGEYDAVEAPTLAKLLTSPVWDDRILGRSEEARLVNDRLWLVTGNNIRFGGDIAQRTVLVHLDPNCPRPDLRSGFIIPDLDEWLENSNNRAKVLHALLVLVRAWIVAGAPRENHQMRSFRRWACAMGGFLNFHELPGFLTNRDELEAQDDEATSWAAFLATWFSKFGSTPKTATDILASAQSMPGGFNFGDDPWNGTFITRANGQLPTAKGLGMMLGSRRGRFFGYLVLHGERDNHRKVWNYRVDRYAEGVSEATDQSAEEAA